MRHVDECTYYPVPCPNGCEVGSIEHDGLERHVEVCSQQVVECEFAHVGCQEVVHRKDLAGHMEQRVQTHLALLSRQMVAIKQELEQSLSLAEQKLKEKDGQIEQLQEELQHLKQWCSHPHKFYLSGFRRLRKYHGRRNFNFTSGGNECSLTAEFSEFSILFSFLLVRGKDSPLQASYRVTLVALDQSGNGNHIRDSKECTAMGDDKFVYVYKLPYGCFHYCNFLLSDYSMVITITVV